MIMRRCSAARCGASAARLTRRPPRRFPCLTEAAASGFISQLYFAIYIIMSVNLATIDLRLLVVFDAVMGEHSVTRAAQRLGMSQPAMSNALNRLRYLLKDQLFLRTAEGMRPTARARELGPPITQALKQIQAALEPATFAPSDAGSDFRLTLSDHATVVVLPRLLPLLQTGRAAGAPAHPAETKFGDRRPARFRRRRFRRRHHSEIAAPVRPAGTLPGRIRLHDASQPSAGGQADEARRIRGGRAPGVAAARLRQRRRSDASSATRPAARSC